LGRWEGGIGGEKGAMLETEEGQAAYNNNYAPGSGCDVDSGEEGLAVLPRHTKVLVTGNNRTKSVLVGLQGVVKKAVGLGGWHWLVPIQSILSKMALVSILRQNLESLQIRFANNLVSLFFFFFFFFRLDSRHGKCGRKLELKARIEESSFQVHVMRRIGCQRPANNKLSWCAIPDVL
jgi:hypothetical protein